MLKACIAQNNSVSRPIDTAQPQLSPLLTLWLADVQEEVGGCFQKTGESLLKASIRPGSWLAKSSSLLTPCQIDDHVVTGLSYLGQVLVNHDYPSALQYHSQLVQQGY